MYGIIGSQADQLAQSLDGYCLREDVGDSDRENDAIGKSLRELMNQVESSGFNLSNYFYRSYIDSWSVANSQFHSIKMDKAKIIGSDQFAVFYAKLDSSYDFSQIKRVTNKYRKQKYREGYWFASSIMDCCDCMEWINSNYVIVSYGEFVGESWTDDMIKDCIVSSKTNAD